MVEYGVWSVFRHYVEDAFFFYKEDVENWTRQVTLLLRKLSFKRSSFRTNKSLQNHSSLLFFSSTKRLHINLFWPVTKFRYVIKKKSFVEFPRCKLTSLMFSNYVTMTEWNTILRCSCMQIACQSSTNQIQPKSLL
jgi:hypothetical protein